MDQVSDMDYGYNAMLWWKKIPSPNIVRDKSTHRSSNSPQWHPWIRMPHIDQSDEDLGNFEASWTPQALCHISWTVPEQINSNQKFRQFQFTWISSRYLMRLDYILTFFHLLMSWHSRFPHDHGVGNRGLWQGLCFLAETSNGLGEMVQLGVGWDRHG